MAAYPFAYSKGYKRADQEHQTYYTQRAAAEEAYKKCLETSPTIGAARECVNRAPYTSREAERAEQDLNAQREMANWAEGTLWATSIVGLLTILVATFGARWVFDTLLVTRRMAEDTREIGEAQVRAYVNVEEAFAETAEKYGVESFPLGVKLKNSGQSPARNVSVQVVEEIKEHGWSARKIGDIAAGREHWLQAARERDSKAEIVSVTFRISYTDVFNKSQSTDEAWTINVTRANDAGRVALYPEAMTAVTIISRAEPGEG